MELKNRTLSNFAELVETGECKKFRGRLKTGIDLGTANTVLAVVDSNNRPIAGASAPSHAIRDGVIVNYYESVQLVTKLKNNMKGALMSVSDKLLLRKCAIIETVNDELKNIAQVEHSRHRSFDNFIVNILGAIAAYCMFPKKPCINVQRTLDTQLAFF